MTETYNAETDDLIVVPGQKDGVYPTISYISQSGEDAWSWNDIHAIANYVPCNKMNWERYIVEGWSWDKFIVAYKQWFVNSRRLVFKSRLDDECRKRISQAYGAEAYQDEIFMRLRNEHTTEQDTKRDLLRAVCRREKAKIDEGGYHDIKAFDVSNVDWG